MAKTFTKYYNHLINHRGHSSICTLESGVFLFLFLVLNILVCVDKYISPKSRSTRWQHLSFALLRAAISIQNSDLLLSLSSRPILGVEISS